MIGVTILVVDRLGRRPLLIGGVSGIVSLPPCKLSKTDRIDNLFGISI
jgi:hypothetical protein